MSSKNSDLIECRHNNANFESKETVHVTCQRPWVTDRYYLRNSVDGSLSPITVSELKSRFGVTDDELLIARAHFVPPLVPISTNDAQVLVADGSITNNPVFDCGFSPMPEAR